MSTREDRIKGVLLGQAAGDALGAGYETGKQVPATGATMCGGGYGFEPGEWTDDTQQAICVAQGMSDTGRVGQLLLKWYEGKPKDVGAQTSRIMSAAWNGSNLLAVSRAYAVQQESQPRPAGWYPGTGNGSLMRTGPACLPFLGDRDAIAKSAREISDLTHADVWSGDACVLWSLAIDRAIETGEAWALADMDSGLELIPVERRAYWAARIAEAMNESPGSFAKGNGSAVGAFMAALCAVMSCIDLEEGLQLAVAAGGDTDTVAAIAGALLGAIYGASAVPEQWREKLHGWPGIHAAGLERLALDTAGVPAA
jgi:ADP-ribosyl-[dinitrogen reductase] hydrolase